MDYERVVDTWITELALSPRHQSRRGEQGHGIRPRAAGSWGGWRNVRQASNKCYNLRTIGRTHYQPIVTLEWS
jgi:hypothetical protein